MSADSSLKTLVKLYRIAGRPPISGLYLTLQIGFTNDSAQLINEIITSSTLKKYIEKDEVKFDNKLLQESPPPAIWNEASVTIKLPRDSINRFHSSISDLINFPSVRNGEKPKDYYLVDLDYYSDDQIKPINIIQLESLCRLIKALSKLAHYHDRKASDGEPRLVFIQGTEGRTTSAILQPVITTEMLRYSDVEYTLVEQLQHDFSVEDVNHHVEKRGIFRNTLVEFTNDNGYDFKMLIEHWTDFRLAYDNNLSVYLSGFNFHKARKEVAAAELEFAEKTSKTISELTTKLLTTPLSLLAAIGIWKVDGLLEQSLILCSVIFTSLVVHLIISSQHKQLNRIIHSKEVIFTPFTKKLKKYPSELQEEINEAIKNLKRNEEFSIRTLRTFCFLCWMPTIIGILIMLYK
ncbi:hypothetical protein AC791_15495 [Klebsiella sp. RIT-PI-d]|uniref:hypothetical protein n=1 Tax=Klebsiella sp. RIT-PI-d TaxID=1681196 RepID=UPI0006762300|nr:hypothetical protein [Klebsiella sp. RIT-PI-d]KNC10011.1 hypothetical protein AC791_15495 [Klebsiella sp. RIT-PI-d]